MVVQTPGFGTVLGGNKSHRHKLRSGCRRAMDPDVALGSSSGPNVIMALGGNTSHSDQHGGGSSMALGHTHGQGW